MCHIIPYSTGMSVPGRMRTYSVACAAVRVRRGSMTTTFALLQLGAFEQVLQRHRMGFGRVAAHDDLRLGVADVGVAVRHRAVAPGIGHAGDGGRMADARLVVGVVGAPERAELAEQIRAFVGHLGRAEPIDRVAAGLLADRHELVADLVDGLRPTDTRVHWPLTSFIGYFRRRSPGTSSRTEAPLAQCEPRLIGESQLGSWPTHTPFDDFGGDGAADRAMRADALADGRAAAHRPAAAGFGLAHGRERQRAERGETAGRQP